MIISHLNIILFCRGEQKHQHSRRRKKKSGLCTIYKSISFYTIYNRRRGRMLFSGVRVNKQTNMVIINTVCGSDNFLLINKLLK